MNLDAYERYVRQLARKGNGASIFNASVDHAAIVIENLFDQAQGRVDILSGFCEARVFGKPPVVAAAHLFLAASFRNRLRIVLDQDRPEQRQDNPFFQMCASLSNVELRIAPVATQAKYGYHFVVADSNSYRYEEDKNSSAAIAAFGHEAGAQHLSSIYDEIWQACKPVGFFPEQL